MGKENKRICEEVEEKEGGLENRSDQIANPLPSNNFKR